MVCHPSHYVVLECFYCVCSPVYTHESVEDDRQYVCVVDFGLDAMRFEVRSCLFSPTAAHPSAISDR